MARDLSGRSRSAFTASFSILRSRISRHHSLPYIEAHFIFCEGERALLLAFVALQESSAHQRQFLQRNAIAPSQCEIGLNQKFLPDFVFPMPSNVNTLNPRSCVNPMRINCMSVCFFYPAVWTHGHLGKSHVHRMGLASR